MWVTARLAGVLSSVSHSLTILRALYLCWMAKPSAGHSDSLQLLEWHCFAMNENVAVTGGKERRQSGCLQENDKNKHPFSLQF